VRIICGVDGGADHDDAAVLQRYAPGDFDVSIAAGPMPVEGQTLGVHGTHWTPSSIYQRYVNLERRRRRYPESMRWFEPYGQYFCSAFSPIQPS
jgi:hypothetical protein